MRLTVEFGPVPVLRMTDNDGPLQEAFVNPQPQRGVVVYAPMGQENRPPSDALKLIGDAGGNVALSRFAPALIAVAQANREVDFYARGRRIPTVLPDTLITALRCVARVDRLNADDACRVVVPVESFCDTTEDARALATASASDRARRVASCWSVLDTKATSELRKIEDSARRNEPCARLLPLLSDKTDAAAAVEFADLCKESIPPDDRERVRLTVLRASVDAAYAKLGNAGTDQLRNFYFTYYDIGDPRVEQVRVFAMRRFGPPDPARFVATRQAVAKMASKSFSAQLCSFDGETAQVVFTMSMAGGVGMLLNLASGGGLKRQEQILKQNVARVEQAAKSGVGAVKVVTRARSEGLLGSGGCGATNDWFLSPRPWPIGSKMAPQLPGKAGNAKVENLTDVDMSAFAKVMSAPPPAAGSGLKFTCAIECVYGGAISAKRSRMGGVVIDAGSEADARHRADLAIPQVCGGSFQGALLNGLSSKVSDCRQ